MRTCLICNKEYKLSDDGAGYKYCSKDCSLQARRNRNRNRWRKANPGWDKGTNKVCEWCGQPYEVPPGYQSISKYCSIECQQTWYSRKVRGCGPQEEYLKERNKQKQERQVRLEEKKQKAYLSRLTTKECEWCGKEFTTDIPTKLTCSDECKKKRNNRRNWERQSNRLNNENVIDRDISIIKLYKRDKGVCYICGGKCDFKDHQIINGNFISGPNYPSIDHIIPLARSGMHAWDNVKLTHHYCNSMKSDILPSELELDIDIDNNKGKRNTEVRERRV